MKKPHVLIVSAGAAAEYREYLLKSISQEYRVTLLDHRDLKWTREYIYRRIPFDVSNSHSTNAALVMHNKDPFDGVLCWDETRILQATRLAEALELRCGGLKAVEACRDKHLTRTTLLSAGILQPQSVVVDNVDEAFSAANRIGYPVIVKPRALMASEGVAIARSPEELEEVFGQAVAMTLDVGTDLQFSSVLVEEFVSGPEYSMDGAVVDGTYHPLFIAHKTLAFAPSFEEISHEVRGADPLLGDEELLRLMQDAHVALGLHTAMTHVEFRISPKGIVIIEVNARLGGDLIPRVGWYATGIDAGLVAAAIAVGSAPPWTQTKSINASIRFVYPGGPMTIASVAWAPTNGIVEASALAHAGDLVDVPPAQFVIGRLAYAIAAGPSSATNLEALSQFETDLQVTTV